MVLVLHSKKLQLRGSDNNFSQTFYMLKILLNNLSKGFLIKTWNKKETIKIAIKFRKKSTEYEKEYFDFVSRATNVRSTIG